MNTCVEAPTYTHTVTGRYASESDSSEEQQNRMHVQHSVSMAGTAAFMRLWHISLASTAADTLTLLKHAFDRQRLQMLHDFMRELSTS